MGLKVKPLQKGLVVVALILSVVCIVHSESV